MGEEYFALPGWALIYHSKECQILFFTVAKPTNTLTNVTILFFYLESRDSEFSPKGFSPP